MKQIIYILCIAYSASAHAQDIKYHLAPFPPPYMQRFASGAIFLSHGNSSGLFSSATMQAKARPPLQLIPDTYYASHLGFFCRQELKMQQAHVPVSFRVGSMDDCNRLEQKPGYRNTPDNYAGR